MVGDEEHEAENEMKTKNRLHRYDMNRPRPRPGHKYTKYKMCQSTIMVISIKQNLSKSEAQLMKKLSNTDIELKKSVA